METKKVAHYWAAEGAGEVTRNWFRPVCGTTHVPEPRMHRDQFKGTGPQADGPTSICPDCQAIIDLTRPVA